MPGARVTAFGTGCFAEAEASEDGSFVLDGLSGAVVFVGARGVGYGTMVTMVAVDGGVDLELLADRAFAIAGRVIAEGDPDRGISGAEVRVHPLTVPGAPAATTTGEDGRFEISGLLPGAYNVFAKRAGMLLSTGVVIEIADADARDVRIAMKRGVALSGRIEPPAIAELGLAPINWDLEAGMRDAHLSGARTRSDAMGTFQIVGVPDGNFELRAMAEDGRSGSIHVTVGDEDLAELVVPLSPRRSAAGRVTDTDGRPLAGYHVFPYRLDGPLTKRMLRDNIYRGATTADDGTFAIVGLEAVRYRLTVQRPGPGGLGSSTIDVDLGDGDLTNTVIAVPVHTAEVRGHVLGLDGAPVLGLWVTASCEPGEPGGRTKHSGSAQTDRHGAFVIGNVPAGIYSLLVHDMSRPVGELRGVQTAVPVTVQLAPLCSVTIDVSRDGVPARDVTLICRRGNYRHDATEVAGAHTFTDVIPGDYEYEASGPAGVATGTVTVSAEHSVLRLALGDHATLTGVLVDLITGAPLPGMVLMAPGTSTETDEHGRFVLERLAPRTGELLIAPRNLLGYAYEKCAYRTTAGERSDLGTIALPAPRTTDPGTFGLSLEDRDGDLRVARIAKHSPADLAAIIPGATIVAIANHAVSALGLDRARKLLASDNVPIGQTLTVVLADARSIDLTSIAW